MKERLVVFFLKKTVSSALASKLNQRLIWYVFRLWNLVTCVADVSNVSSSSE